MKKALFLIAVLLAFTGAAMADTTSADSTTALTVTVISPITLSCPSTLSYQLVAGTGTTPAAKAFSCTTSGGSGLTPDTGGVSMTYQLDQAPTHSSDTIAASDVSVSADGGSNYATASTSSPVALTLPSANSVAATYNMDLKVAQQSGSQAAGDYTANMTFTLNVTYTP